MIHSQVEIHAEYGGIVPELASRAHVEKLGAERERGHSQGGARSGKVSVCVRAAQGERCQDGGGHRGQDEAEEGGAGGAEDQGEGAGQGQESEGRAEEAGHILSRNSVT